MSSSRKITSALALATAAFVSAPVALVATGMPAHAGARRRVSSSSTPSWWIEHQLGKDVRRRVSNELRRTERRVSKVVGETQSFVHDATQSAQNDISNAISEVQSRTSLPGL